MKTWTILYFPDYLGTGTPRAFSCEVVTEDEAEGKCEDAFPGCNCVWADVLPRGVDAGEAIADYLESGKPSAVLVKDAGESDSALYLRGRLAQEEDAEEDDRRLNSFYESLEATGVFSCKRLRLDKWLYGELDGRWPEYLHELTEEKEDEPS